MLEQIIARFKEGTPVVLTPEEEMAVLEWVINNRTFLGAGTTRATYEFMDKYVVKVAISIEGKHQHSVERNFYLEHWDKGLFATLFAYGKTVHIAEKLSDLDCVDDEDTFMELVEDLNYATDYDGGDNEQVGWSNLFNRWVAYDYGYSNEYSHWDLVGNMDSWSYRLDVLEMAYGIVEQDIDFYDSEYLDHYSGEDEEYQEEEYDE